MKEEIKKRIEEKIQKLQNWGIKVSILGVTETFYGSDWNELKIKETYKDSEIEELLDQRIFYIEEERQWLLLIDNIKNKSWLCETCECFDFKIQMGIDHNGYQKVIKCSKEHFSWINESLSPKITICADYSKD